MPKPIFIKQQDITDCGAACLASVSYSYGLKIPISKIREYAKTDKKGTNVLGMIQAAEHLGFSAKGVKGTPDALKEIPVPTIAHVVFENGLHHYIVIFKVNKKHVLVSDPGKGIIKYLTADFLKIWSGVLILLTPNMNFKEGDLRKSNSQRFFDLMIPHKIFIVEAIISAFVYTLLGLGTALYVEYLIDFVFPDANEKLLRILSIAMVAILVFRVFFGWTRQLLLMHVSQRIDAKLILAYYKHILKLPQTFFDTRKVGEIISRVNDAVKIRTAISSASLTIIVDSLVLLFGLALMFLYSWKLALVASLTIPLFIILFFSLNKPIQRTQRELMEKSAELQSHLVSSISGVSTIKYTQAEEFNNVKTELTFVQTLQAVWKSNIQGVVNNNISELIAGGAIIALLWFGGSLVISYELSVGELMSFYTLIGYVTGPASRLIGINQTIQDALIAADRLFEILEMETEEKIHKGKFSVKDFTFDTILFENVSFRYGSRSLVLQNVTFEIPVGKITAIVGESGSGKTTLSRLIQGFYPVTEGSVKFGSVNIQDIKIEDLRNYCGIVPQEIELFHGTVIQNIAYGDPEPDMQKIMSISAFIGIDKFIQKLPYSWSTFLGEHGANLSGGQRQRLAIARVLYRQPRLLILDEATSALDSESEYAIQQALQLLRKQGMTILIIAHRLSTIMNSDQIIVMDYGKVLEKGTHRELMMAEGKYYSLWARQMPVGVKLETTF